MQNTYNLSNLSSFALLYVETYSLSRQLLANKVMEGREKRFTYHVRFDDETSLEKKLLSTLLSELKISLER